MKIETKYNIGDCVFLITDPDQKARIITSISIRPNNSICYEMSVGTDNSFHYDIEFTYDRDIIKATSE